jgi:hypothetical protein
MGLAQSEVSEVGAPTIMFAKVEKKRLPYLWVSVILMDRLRGPEDGSVTYRYRGYLLYNNPEQPIIPSEAFQRSFYEAEVARILGRFSTYTGN